MTAPMLPDTQPLGAIRVAAQSAHIDPWSWFKGHPPNASLTVSTQRKRNVARTKCIHHCFEPSWMETLYIVVHPQDEFLDFSLFSHHAHRKSTLIGCTKFPISVITDSGELTSVSFDLAKDEKSTAGLLADLVFYPSVSGSGTTEISTSAIISCVILEAADLDTVDGHPDILAQVSLSVDGPPIHSTERKKGTRKPVWNSPFDLFCPWLPTTTLTVKVIDAHHTGGLGSFSLGLEDLLERSKAGVEWWPLNACRSGKIRLAIRWWAVDTSV